MPPPPAETVASRFFLAPALRTQADRRLVTLVREGYEAAFEEIVRRYAKPLGHYAAAIVGGRSEDVTQDAFSKALLALRRDDAEIELRPWLYRIVRNTALNDLRDRPPSPEALEEAIEGGSLSAAEEAERREEMTDLMTRLRALPEPQRAAIVMRELEGLSHDEIAAALGISGGAARQTIHRARIALRNGLGMMIPLPLLRTLIDHGTEAAVGTGASGAAIAAGAASAGGAGAGGALKIGVAAALIAGSLGTGVALHERNHGGGEESAAAAAQAMEREAGAAGAPSTPPSAKPELVVDSHAGDGRHRGSGSGHGDRGSHGGSGARAAPVPGDDSSDGRSHGPSSFDSPHHGGSPGSSGSGTPGAEPGQIQGGEGPEDEGSGSGGGPGPSGSPPPPPPPGEDPEGSDGGSGSGSGQSGSDSSSGPGGGDGEPEDPP